MGQPRRRQIRQALIAMVAAISLTGCASVSFQTHNAREERPFFQQEQETEIHGRKNWLDYLVEADPGTFQVETASDYQKRPPAVLAVLPFGDVGDANFTIDKIPITFRNKEQQERWAWTDAQRLRLSVMGHLAQREFRVVNPISVDAVLKQLGIDSMNKLKRVSPLKLGRLLAADAVVYGEVDNYEGYYFGIVSAYHVGVSMWMTSTHDGEMLMHAKGGRYSVDLEPALSPQDFAINSIKTFFSVKTLLEFRDITLARAEEEVGRELVVRIPVSETLKTQLARRALEKAQEADSDQEARPVSQDNPHATNTVLPTTLPLGIGHEHAVGENAEVHQDLARVQQNYDKLNPAGRHEPNDNRCLTEHLIGQWSYSLLEQERTCSEALARPGSVDGAMVSSLSIKEDTLDLLVSQDDLPTVATNLYKFVRINDAFAARCGCDARTNVGVGDVGFPAYLFRLDPEERTSKILIAIGGPAIGFTPKASTPRESVSQPVEAQASAHPERCAKLTGIRAHFCSDRHWKETD